MLQFILSCMLLLSIVLWWGEAKYNFIHGRIMWFKRVCTWIRNQTKLQVDVCKWFMPCILLGSISYVLVNSLYYPYFQETTEFKDGAITLKNYSEKKVFEEAQDPVLKVEIIDNGEKESPIGDWGTFGDFIGGTLNPIIGLISIFLLFVTWRLTSNSFKSTDSALKFQQFDSWFFNLLQSFQSINSKYSKYVVDEDFYKKLFLTKEPNLALSKNILLIQYFSSLNILLKIVNSKLEFIQSQKEKDELKLFYVDIILAQISGDILQIIVLYSFQDGGLKITLENCGFFKKIDFKYYVDSNSKFLGQYNFELLSHLHRYDEKVFYNSKNYLGLKKTYLYNIFFGEEPFIYKFFQKQYKSRVVLEIEGLLTKSIYELVLIFDEDGVKWGEWYDSKNGYGFQTIKYQNFIFNDLSILIPLNNMKIIIPSGNIYQIGVNSDTYKFRTLKVE